MTKQTILVLDVLTIVALLLFSAWASFFALLAGPGYLGLTIGMLVNAGGVGAVLYILSDYSKTGRFLSIILLVFAWLFGLVAVVFGLRAGPGIAQTEILIPKLIVFLYPLIFLTGVFKKSFGDKMFKAAVLLFAGLSIGLILLIVAANGGIEVTGAGFIALLFLAVWLSSILYSVYRLLKINGFRKG